MVREAIFDMLGPRIIEATVLDLFSGSGLLGLEAKSRGAKQVFFVERDKTTCKILKNNLASFTQLHETPILCNTANKAMKQLLEAGIRFDIVLVDPPYDLNINPVLNTLSSTGIVKPKGWVVVERSKLSLDIMPENFAEIKKKTYGYTRVTIFQLINSQVKGKEIP